MWFARAPLYVRLVERASPLAQAGRVFALELALLAVAAVVLGIYNIAANDFPLVSGMKILVGITAMGFFAAADLALERERLIAADVEHEGRQLKPSSDFFPLASKMAACATVVVALLVGVFALLVNKDLDWLFEVGTASTPKPRSSPSSKNPASCCSLLCRRWLISSFPSHAT